MRLARVRGLAFALALGGAAPLLGGLPGEAAASPDTLRMAFENLLQGPVDMALAPVTAGRTVAQNLDDVGPAPVAPAAYAVLGHPGLTLLQVGCGALRMVSGAVLLVPGVVLFPFEDVDVPPEANVFGRGPRMLVDEQNPLADEPEWLEYVPPATPATMDAELGIQVPYSEYAVDPENPAFPPPPREALPLDAPLED